MLSFKEYHPGWLAASVSGLLFLLHFPGHLGSRAPSLLVGTVPCLFTAPSHAQQPFNWRIPAASPPGSLAGSLVCKTEGREVERVKNKAALGGFVGKEKNLIFFLYPS